MRSQADESRRKSAFAFPRRCVFEGISVHKRVTDWLSGSGRTGATPSRFTIIASLMARGAYLQSQSRFPLEPLLLECNRWGRGDSILECSKTPHRGCHWGQEHLGRPSPPMGHSARVVTWLPGEFSSGMANAKRAKTRIGVYHSCPKIHAPPLAPRFLAGTKHKESVA